MAFSYERLLASGQERLQIDNLQGKYTFMAAIDDKLLGEYIGAEIIDDCTKC
jgi:hypothetical protein